MSYLYGFIYKIIIVKKLIIGLGFKNNNNGFY